MNAVGYKPHISPHPCPENSEDWEETRIVPDQNVFIKSNLINNSTGRDVCITLYNIK